MTREIKFRAWDKKVGQMINHIASIVWDFNGRPILLKSIYDLEIKDGQNSGTYERLINQIVLMQFTGLKDKNGNEIYEGDIFMDEEDGSTNYVIWDEILGGWDTNEWYDPKDLVDHASSLEIIGNIYENPELIKK